MQIIHLHAVARLEGVREDSSLVLNGKLLAAAIELAANQVSLFKKPSVGLNFVAGVTALPIEPVN